MQKQQERQQRRPRWGMSVGEWMILLLNILIAGASATLGLFAILWGSFRSPTQHLPLSVYLLGGSLLLIALGAGLTSLVLLLRQTRLAAWLQWLAAVSCVLFAGVYLFVERHLSSLATNLLTIGTLLLLVVFFIFSGRFLRTISDSSDS